MMVDLFDYIGGGLVAVGALLSLIGALGVLRFPDVYTRIHAASITDTGGATLILIGLSLIAGWSMETLKLVVAWFFLLLTTPVAAHALGNAAFSAGHAPWIGAFRSVKGEKRR
jgi:multicomponent Na+:H+ antiporter subunit G